MKKQLVLVSALVIVLAIFTSGFASAAGIPVGSCPPGFHEHATSDHHDGHMHKHVGNSFDQNGDGILCVKHVTPDGSIHVHIDNRVR